MGGAREISGRKECTKILERKSLGKRLPGKVRLMSKDTIKIDLQGAFMTGAWT
jgi:hypothetical protein